MEESSFDIWTKYRMYHSTKKQKEILLPLVKKDDYLTFKMVISSIQLWHFYFVIDQKNYNFLENMIKDWQNELPTPRDPFPIVLYLAKSGDETFFEYCKDVFDIQCKNGIILTETAKKMAEHVRTQTNENSEILKSYYNIVTYLIKRGINVKVIEENDRQDIINYFLIHSESDVFELIRPIANENCKQQSFFDKMFDYATSYIFS